MGALTPCVDDYPDNLYSWLVYGPFDLSDAAAAEVLFQRWQRTESGFDFFKWKASVDDDHYYGWESSGYTQGWDGVTFDLCDPAGAGDFCGQPRVWVAFILQSDESLGDLGVFLDDVVVRKRTAAAGSSPHSGEAVPAGSASVRPAYGRRP